MKKIALLLTAVICCISCKKEENSQKKYGENVISAEYAIPLGF